MGFGSKNRPVAVLGPPDPSIARNKLRLSEENRQKAFTRFIVRQRLRGPSQLDASAPGLRFLTRQKKQIPEPPPKKKKVLDLLVQKRKDGQVAA